MQCTQRISYAVNFSGLRQLKSGHTKLQSRPKGEDCEPTGTVRRPARRPHISLAIISITVPLWTLVFWVIWVYFNIRNTLPKSGTFLLGHPVYTDMHTHTNTYIHTHIYTDIHTHTHTHIHTHTYTHRYTHTHIHIHTHTHTYIQQ